MDSEYRDHLNTVHSVQNIEECFRLAAEKLEHEKKKRVIEEIIIIDDDGNDSEKVDDTSDVDSTRAGSNCRLIRLIERGSFKRAKDDTEDGHFNELLKDDEGITKYFMNLREKVKKFEFPKEMLDKMKHISFTSNEESDCSGDALKKSCNSDVQMNSCGVCKSHFGTKSKLQTHMEVHKASIDSCVKTEDYSRKKPTQEKRFACPLPDCSFWVDKSGMKGGKAAIHLSKDHMIKPKDMVPGQFKFNKITVKKDI